VGILTEEMKRRHRDSAHRQGTAEDVSLTTFCRYEGLQADETTGSSSPATICGVVDRAVDRFSDRCPNGGIRDGKSKRPRT
jgi:hypothetical protein